jgi:hypothetical protein
MISSSATRAARRQTPVRPLGTGSSEWPVIVPSDHEIPERVITISQKGCNLGVAILYTLMKNGHAASGKAIAEPMRHDGRVSLAQPRNLIMTNNYSGRISMKPGHPDSGSHLKSLVAATPRARRGCARALSRISPLSSTIGHHLTRLV